MTTPEDIAVADRVPPEGFCGPVILFHHQNEIPIGAFSNFFPAPITINNKSYATSEHYFQQAKLAGVNEDRRELIRTAPEPGIAAELGRDRSFNIRTDWDAIKETVMMDALVAKFCQHPLLLFTLMQTKFCMLVEHTHRDSYYGDGGDGSGKNRLGILLMQLREILSRLSNATLKPDEQPDGAPPKPGEKRFAWESPCNYLESNLDRLRIAIGQQYARTAKRYIINGKFQAKMVSSKVVDVMRG